MLILKFDLAFKYDYKNEYSLLKSKNLQLCKYRFGDVFEIPDKQKSHCTNESIQGANYPLIGAAKTNNGIVGYLNTYDYENCFTLAKNGNGACGYIFYHNHKFNRTTDVYIMNLKQKISDININCKLISLQLHTIFNHQNKINKEIIKDSEIYLYV